MTKTLGQIYRENWIGDKMSDQVAAGIAAVARHVFGELMSAHLAEHHAKPVEPEPAKGEADWAMVGWISAKEHWFHGTRGYDLSKTPQNPTRSDNIECAVIIREAAEQHYGAVQKRLASQHAATLQLLDALRASSTVEHAKRLADRLDAMEQERDAARERVKALEAELEQAAAQLQKTPLFKDYKAIGLREVAAAAEQVCDELDAARAEVEKLRAALELKHADSRYRDEPTPPAAVAGEDELIEAVERGIDGWTPLRWRSQCCESVLVEIRPLFDALRQRAEAAEAALAWSWSYTTLKTFFNNSADEILAAHRAAKEPRP